MWITSGPAGLGTTALQLPSARLITCWGRPPGSAHENLIGWQPLKMSRAQTVLAFICLRVHGARMQCQFCLHGGYDGIQIICHRSGTKAFCDTLVVTEAAHVDCDAGVFRVSQVFFGIGGIVKCGQSDGVQKYKCGHAGRWSVDGL